MKKGAFREPPDERWKSDRVAQTDRTDSTKRRLRPSGGYRQLRSFQTTTIIYDGTVLFCGRFVNPRSRTHDQMVQAARSGRQNIAEGSRAGATSSKSETFLTNVARASLDELLLDFKDYLRQGKRPQWTKDTPEACLRRPVSPSGREGVEDLPIRSKPCLVRGVASP